VNRQTNDILAMGINQRYAQDINTLVLKNGSGFHGFLSCVLFEVI